MPQVNEISWISISTKLIFFIVMFVLLVSYCSNFCWKKLNSSLIKVYKNFFIL